MHVFLCNETSISGDDDAEKLESLFAFTLIPSGSLLISHVPQHPSWYRILAKRLSHVVSISPRFFLSALIVHDVTS